MAFGALALAVTMNGSAQAAHSGHSHHGHSHHGHSHVGLGLGFGTSYGSSGHYEYRNETYMVSPARVEQRFIPAVYRTEVTSGGVALQILVREGYWESYTIPAQYETRTVSVWVEDYCAPTVRVGLGFRF